VISIIWVHGFRDVKTWFKLKFLSLALASGTEARGWWRDVVTLIKVVQHRPERKCDVFEFSVNALDRVSFCVLMLWVGQNRWQSGSVSLSVT